MTGAEFMIVLFAMIGGAIRVSTPFMFVALGECLTEKSGRINLGHEGNLVLGAMVAYAVSFITGSPWLGVLAAGGAGLVLGAMHGWICALPRVNDIAVGIAFMSFGTGLAFFFGKEFIQPSAPRLEAIGLGDWTGNPAIAQAFQARGGVCQDFAHIMIAGLRGLALPSAYVSGYIRTVPPPGQPRLEGADASHAWVAVWCGDPFGWIHLDPTNGMFADDNHIVVAIGRDYADVSPIDGVIVGAGRQALEVSVDIKAAGGAA